MLRQWTATTQESADILKGWSWGYRLRVYDYRFRIRVSAMLQSRALYTERI